MAKKPEREIERWVTWHGRRIPIYKGESKAEVAERMKASFKQGVEKGKEGRPETAKSVQDKQQKAKKASEKRHQKHLNMENKGHTPRRIENYKKAVEEETKAHEAAGKALEKSRIQGVKFNRPSQKAESKQDQKWVSDFKKDFAKTRAQAEKMFHENDSEDIKDILKVV